MAAALAIPDLSAPDHNLLLEVTTPAGAFPPQSRAQQQSTDSIRQARFLSRPDIEPHLELLQNLADFRDRLQANHLTHKAAQALLSVAEKTDDLVEKRRAATAILHFVRILERGANRAHRRPSHTESEGAYRRPSAPTPEVSIPSPRPARPDGAPAHHATNGQAAPSAPTPKTARTESTQRPGSLANAPAIQPSTTTPPRAPRAGRTETREPRAERRAKRTSSRDRIRSLTTAAGAAPTFDTG